MLRAAFPWCADWPDELKELFRTYVLLKQENNVLDYDDLLLYWRHLMEEPALAGEVRARFDHVLVDEDQDTNALQAAILLCTKPDGRGVTVVGDDAQSIYSFRAATVRNIRFVAIARARDSASSGSSKKGHSPNILQWTEPTRNREATSHFAGNGKDSTPFSSAEIA
jgi:DNA helicase IV